MHIITLSQDDIQSGAVDPPVHLAVRAAGSRRVQGLGPRPKGSRGVNKSADVAAGA